MIRVTVEVFGSWEGCNGYGVKCFFYLKIY